MAKWGKDTPRKQMSEHYWHDPIRWERKAVAAGVRARVFCSSMADVFEDHKDLVAPRLRLWDTIAATPHLDWLLLTKRPANMVAMAPAAWRTGWPANVWPGTTTEDQKWFDKRIGALAGVPARTRWLSVEPMLGPVVLGRWANAISWCIVGGESGNGARLMEPKWATDLLAECRRNKIAYHFKQKGRALAAQLGCKDREGKDNTEWPAEFLVQEFPVPVYAT